MIHKKKHGKVLVTFLGLFSFVQLFSQYNADSLKNIYAQAKSDTAKVTMLNKIAAAYGHIDSATLAAAYARQALQLALKINNPKKVAESQIDVSDKLHVLGELDSALLNAKSALLYYGKQTPAKDVVKAFKLMGDLCYENGQYSVATDNYSKAGADAKLLKDSLDMRAVYYDQGMVYDASDQYELAREQCMRSIELAIPLKQYRAAIGAYIIIGNDYAKQGVSASAVNAYFSAEDINQKYLHEESVTGIVNIDVGNVYNDKDDTTNAMKYYNRALDVFVKIKQKKYAAQALENMGNVYMKEGDFKKAEGCELKCMDEISQTGDKLNTALCYSNVAEFYDRTKQYDKAKTYYQLSVKMQTDIGDKEGLVYSLEGLGDMYVNMGDYKEAAEYGVRAFDSASSIQILGQVCEEAKKLSDIFDKLHQPDKAFYYYKSYVKAKDSLDNKEEAKKLINAELSHEYEQKQQMEKLEDEKRQAIADEHERHEQVIRNIYLAAFIVVLFLTGLLFRNLRRIRKSNQIITEQKLEVERQKLIVDEKNKDITDSIKYASRIQRALLTSHEYISKQVKDHFILFKPRDIVSGDFYWAFRQEDGTGRFYLACCDCTGHGVPGAFMSLLNISMLNESVIERKITEPEKVLNDIRNNIIKALNPEKADSESKDGMDCALCAFDFKNKTMQLACANNPVWIVKSNGEFVEVNPDKMPVGIQHGDQRSFTLHTINLTEGDTIYMFTDGYADQFGGPKGKKFKYKQLQEIVVANSQKPMKEQKEILERTFTEWMGGLEQIDDMLVIGIKV